MVTHESLENSYFVWPNRLGLPRCFLLGAYDGITPYRGFLCHYYIGIVAHGIKLREG